MKPRLSVLVAVAGALLASYPAAALDIVLPEERTRLIESTLPGYPLAQSLCYTCHSVDYVRMQPGTTARAGWKTLVVKMQKTFGAVIPDDAIDPIADYLVRTYGAEKNGATQVSAATQSPAAASSQSSSAASPATTSARDAGPSAPAK